MMRQSLTRTLCCSMRCMHQSAPLQQQSVQQLTVQLRRYASSSSWDLAGPAYSPSTSTTSTAGRASYPQAAVQRRTVSSPASASSDGSPTEVVDDVAISSGSGGPFDASLGQDPSDDNLAHDWSRSYHGLSQEPFSKDISDVLLAPLTANDIEIKPDGLIYLPEIKYRRILNRAFGPGGWGLAPRGETHVGAKLVSREYALVCLGRLVSVSRGEQDYYDASGIPTATEGCKSNALMRCCKDLGVASELWDPRFIREFKSKHCSEVWGEHVVTKKKKKVWRRKDEKLTYPFEEK